MKIFYDWNTGGKAYQINQEGEILGERDLPKYGAEKTEITFLGLKGDFNVYRRKK